MYVHPKRVFNPAIRKAVWHGGIKQLSRSYRNYAAIAYARTQHTKHKRKGFVHKNYCQIYTNAKIQIKAQPCLYSVHFVTKRYSIVQGALYSQAPAFYTQPF